MRMSGQQTYHGDPEENVLSTARPLNRLRSKRYSPVACTQPVAYYLYTRASYGNDDSVRLDRNGGSRVPGFSGTPVRPGDSITHRNDVQHCCCRLIYFFHFVFKRKPPSYTLMSMSNFYIDILLIEVLLFNRISPVALPHNL